MKAYPVYQDSGIPWLGKIPESWDVTQYRAYFAERKEPNSNFQEKNLLSLSYGKIIRKDINKTEGLLPASFATYNIIEAGDIVLRLTDLQNDHKSLRTALCTQRGIITSAYVTLRPLYHGVISSYFQYQLHIYDVRKSIYGAGGGVRQTMNYDAIARLKACVPSVEEQKTIVAYLDKKCAEIQELINRRQTMIELLKELKQSIIAKAVTKGLNPNVPMKDSGIPWLGKIPESWDVTQYRAYFAERKEPNSNFQEKNLLSLSYGKIIRKDINKTEGLLPASFATYNIIEAGDIVLRLTDLQNDHKSLRTALCTQRGIITSAYVTLRPLYHGVISSYFQYQLHIYDVRKSIYGAGGGVRQTMNYDAIARLKACVPSVEEQKAIVAYLDKKCAAIDELISRHEQSIEKLKELRTATIANVVTGKVDVRESI